MTVAHDDRTETGARRDTMTVDDIVTVDSADADQHERDVPSRARNARARHIALQSHRSLLQSLSPSRRRGPSTWSTASTAPPDPAPRRVEDVLVATLVCAGCLTPSSCSPASLS